MSGLEMLGQFKIGYEEMAGLAAPGFLDGDIYSFINKSQDTIIAGFAQSKQLIYLAPIIKSNTLTLSLIDSNIYGVTLPIDFRYYVSSESKIRLTSSISSEGFIPSAINTFPTVYELVDNIEITLDSLGKLRKTKTNSNLYFSKPFITTRDNQLLLLIDSYSELATVDNFNLIYIRIPAQISETVNCELIESTHRDIVNMAIKMAQSAVDNTKIRQ